MSGGDEALGTSTVTSPEGRAKVAYYALGLAPPARYADWVRRDIQSSSWLKRRWATAMVALFLGAVIGSAVWQGPSHSMLAVMVGGTIGMTLSFWLLASYSRRRALRYYEKRWQRQRGF